MIDKYLDGIINNNCHLQSGSNEICSLGSFSIFLKTTATSSSISRFAFNNSSRSSYSFYTNATTSLQSLATNSYITTNISPVQLGSFATGLPSLAINLFTSFVSSCLYAARHFIPYSFSLWMYSTRRYRELSNTLAHLSAYYSTLFTF